MVGVEGGRSKGCQNCRQRKVKCDETRPQCQRCLRAGATCLGYARDLKWVHEGGSTRSQSSSSGRRAAPKGNTGRKGRATQINRSLSAVTEDTYLCFLVEKLFDGGSRTQAYDHQTWITAGIEAGPDCVSYVALQSLAKGYFGRRHGNTQKVLAEAATLYGKALRQLWTSLQDPKTCYDHMNVSATMALNLYEIIVYTAEDGWIQHAGGIGRLIEARGPEKHQEYPEHGYFILSRPIIIFQATNRRKRVFLEEDKWMTVPWLKHPETRTELAKVQDFLAYTPGLAEDGVRCHMAMKKGEDTRAVHKSITLRNRKLAQRLIAWRRNWELSRGTVAYEMLTDPSYPMTAPEPGEEPIFPIVIYYKKFSIAQEILYYNIALMCVIHYAQLLHDSEMMCSALSVWPESERHSDNPLIIPFESLTHVEISREICRSIEYLILEHQVSQGAYSLLVPLRIAFLSISADGNEKERLWITRVIERMADASGFEIYRHMTLYRQIGRLRKIEGLTNRFPQDLVERDMKNTVILERQDLLHHIDE